MQNRLFPLSVLILAIFILGAGTVYARFSDGNVFANMFFRMIFAMPFYGLLMLKGKQYKGKHWQDKRLNIFFLILAGVFFAFDQLLFFSAINYTSIGLAFLIIACAPLVVLVLSVIFYRELPPILFWPGLFLVLLGMYLTIGIGKAEGTGHPEEWRGFLYATGSLLSFGIYMFIFGFCQTTLGIWQKMMYLTVSATITVVIVGVITGNTLILPNTVSWLAVLGLSINSQLMGASMLVFAMHRLPMNLSGVFVLCLPLTGSLWGWLFFNETVTYIGLLGMVLCLNGVYLAKRAYDDIEYAHGHDTQEDDILPPS